MKTKFRQLLWLFVTLLFAAACSTDDGVGDPSDDGGGDPSATQTSTVTFTAQMNAPATKATDTAFDSGDKISVTAYAADGSIFQSNVEYGYSSNSFTSTSPIKYTATNSELEFRALYPCVEMSADKTANFAVFTDQNSGTNYTLSDLMFGYAALTSDESPQLVFDHLLTKIVVNITSSDVDMAGASASLSALVEVECDLSALTSSNVGTAQTITMASNGTNSYKAIIIPQTIDSSAPFGVISTTSGDYEFYITSTTNLQGGSQYTINASIENGEITFDSPIINDWNEGEFGEVDERTILEQIYYATGGDDWTENENWCTDAALSEWYGVTLDDETGCVTELYFFRNNLVGDLDVSALTNLTYLSCGYNQLTTLDVSALTNLTTLSCNSNQLTTLDVSGLTNLTTLSCDSNQLTTLDVSALTNLTYLSCGSNQLTTLDMSALTNLSILRCYSNQLTTLDVSALTNLTILHCRYNELATLDVSALTNLTYLSCDSNQLTTLDMSGLTNLTTLSCYSNQLTTLDVSGLTNLTDLYCDNNYLTTIYLYSIPTNYFSYTSWGDYNTTLYTEPTHKDGYQYPEFYYVSY